MHFINPIEILGLQKLDISEIDGSVIKKAKRVLYADIDLSEEQQYYYKSLVLHKSDCEKAINELDEKNKIQFYHLLSNNSLLNDFLAIADTNIFTTFRFESYYKQVEFIDFISPYFTQSFNIALLKAFQKNELSQLRKIVSAPPLVNEENKEKLYTSLQSYIKIKIEEVEKQTRKIKNEESEFNETNIKRVYVWTQAELDNIKINLLPNYFQATRNQCATAIRNLSVNVYNAFSDIDVAFSLINYALSFEVDGITKQKITNDFKQLEEIKRKNDEDSQIEPILKKYASFIVDARLKVIGLKSKSISVKNVQEWIEKSIDINDVNALSGQFDEIKDQIAIVLRALSVEVWNNYFDIDSAFLLVQKALSISKLSESTKANLLEAKEKIMELSRQSAIKTTENYPRTQTSSPGKLTSSSTKSQNTGCIWVAILFLLFGGIKLIINYNENSDNGSKPSKYTFNAPVYNPPEIPVSDSSAQPKTVNYEKPPPVPAESPYKGNKLKNGSSPFNTCFGKGKFSGSAWIQFENSNDFDAIVCLVNVQSNRTIRNEYIRAGSKFKVLNIPSGTYYLKVCYGNNWNPTLTNFCGEKGAFESDTHFSKSDKYDDYIVVRNTEYSYTTGRITLYTVRNGNMSTEYTTEADFFNN